ncbi:unnamed protein product, partial [Mesorhabditis spiculigera]
MRTFVVAVCLLAQAYAQFDFTTCGSGKTCVLKPANCGASPSTCTQGVSFKRASASFLEIEMFANNLPATATYDSYMAIAFQPNKCDDYESNGVPCMANSSVTECSALNGKLMTASLSWNNLDPKNVRIDNAADLAKAVSLSLSALTSSNGQTYCKTMQRITGAPLNGVANSDKVFQLVSGTQYAVMMAVGPANGTVIAHHTGVAMSTARMMIQSISETDIKIELFWNPDDATQDDNAYLAVAFTETCEEKCMKNTKVSECSQLIGQSPSLKFSWNNDRPDNERFPNSDDLSKHILKNLTYGVEGKQIYCSYQQTVLGVPRLLNGIQNSDKVFAAVKGKKYMVLMAAGPTDEKGMKHHKSKILSNEAFELFPAEAAPTTVVAPVTTTTGSAGLPSTWISMLLSLMCVVFGVL